MGTWTIRDTTEHDVDAVLELWLMAGGASSITDTSEGLLRLLDTDCEALLVAEAGGAIVGSLIAAWDGWRGSFYRLAVHPGHRRQGLATVLLREGERRLRARGAVRLTVIVSGADPAAIAFWKSVGYEPRGDQARYVRHIGT